MKSYLIKLDGTTIGGEIAPNKVVAFDQWRKETFGDRPQYSTLEFKDGICQTTERIEVYPLGVGIISIIESK
jgi:hypothetical protein